MKKLLASLLSTAMVFTLAGCGSSKDHLATIQDNHNWFRRRLATILLS